ncbi:hypothetical protein M758_5G163400 [Ceratodon purpureus]|uniref:Secreted protein n=1 Tax=Ceratodon purpureus TaxID=3225 RepID=A0A8T0I2H9_CERPU|nr:hypothetical protein KC19_5G170200 [Ceratodon purpureus]KAG0617100.1 hypothetical protein M758_5G163400 [Ceratodon purpureus]
MTNVLSLIMWITQMVLVLRQSIPVYQVESLYLCYRVSVIAVQLNLHLTELHRRRMIPLFSLIVLVL